MKTATAIIRRPGWLSLNLLVGAPGGMSAHQVCSLRNISPASVWVTFERAESMGLVERLPGEHSNRFDRLWRITELGRQRVDEALRKTRNQPLPQPAKLLVNTTNHAVAESDRIVRRAISTQPCSVFDLARVMPR